MPLMDQKVALAKRPHVIVATPGRLQEHLESTKGFSLRNLKYFVMDEADKLLSPEFSPVMEQLLSYLPTTRQVMLFSATFPIIVKDFKVRCISIIHLTKA